MVRYVLVATDVSEIKRFQDLLLIAVSGCGQPQDRARAPGGGLDRHIVKPLQIDPLTAVLSGCELRVSA